jgi:hypothetical protein
MDPTRTLSNNLPPVSPRTDREFPDSEADPRRADADDQDTTWTVKLSAESRAAMSHTKLLCNIWVGRDGCLDE